MWRDRKHNRLPGSEPLVSEDSAPHYYDGIGAILRRERERYALELDTVSEILRIKTRQLAAIEEGRFDLLPGQIYAMGFVRSYAEYLNFDGQDVVERFKQELANDIGPTELQFPVPSSDSVMPKGATVMLSLLAAIAVYGIWYGLNSNNDALTGDRIALAPPASAPSVEEPTIAKDQATESVAPTLEERISIAVAESARRAGLDVTQIENSELSSQSSPLPDADLSQEAEEQPPIAAAEEPGTTINDTGVAATASGTSSQATADQVAASVPAVTPAAPLTPRPEAAFAAVAPASSVSDEGSSETYATANPAPQSQQRTALSATASNLPPQLSMHARTADDVLLGGDLEANGYVPQVYGTANKDARVVLHASADSWVQIRGANSEVVLTRILRAGDQYMAPNRVDLLMMTGNAGGIKIAVDGEYLAPLGEFGQVRRGISLDPDKLRDQ